MKKLSLIFALLLLSAHCLGQSCTASSCTAASCSEAAALAAAPGLCHVWQDNGATTFGIGPHAAPTTTAFSIDAAVTVASSTVTVGYHCIP
jgi:hypothetical protein